MMNESNKTAHSLIVLKAFNDLCDRAYSDWRFHKIIFTENARKAEMEKSIAGKALEHFSILSQESILLQIAKLHDPAIQQGHVTLGIEYMVRFGGWDCDQEEKLKKLKNGLDELATKIRPARHKILSHNDLETILSEAVLGDFPDGEDEKYFRTLQEFLDLVNLAVMGEKHQLFAVVARIPNGLLWFFREDACKNQPVMI